jgi:hypothetical protein
MSQNEIAEEIKYFSTEITTAIEDGINHHLSCSFFYSPFRLALSLFKKANPKLMNQIRRFVRDDIERILLEIPNYDETAFIKNNELSIKGAEGYKVSFNLGVHLMKNKINVKMAFRAIRDNETRNQIYDYILRMTRKSIDRIVNGNKINLK